MTKNGWVDGFAEPLGGHWDEEIANKLNIETKHVRAYSKSKVKNELVKIQCGSNRNKIVGREAGNAT